MAKPATFRKPKTGRDAQFQKDKKNSANPEYIFETNRRGRKVKKKNPKYIPPTRKSDGSKLESTTSGSTKSQGTSQQEVIDNPEYQGGLKKMQTKWKKQAADKAAKLKIGQELAAQFKKDDADIAAAAAYKNKKDSKKLEKPKETEAEARAKWEEKTKNSPARRSGAWHKDELWEKQKAHRKWKSDRKEGKLKTEKFDPRKPRGYKRKMVEKTPAELAAERRKKEVKAAKNNKSSNKISPSVPVEKKKKKPGFDAERPGSNI